MQLKQIGVVHSPFHRAAGTPVQPFCAAGTEGQIEVFDAYLDGLQDLDGFQRIWVLFWCHRARRPKLRVIPYRDTVAHGLFATRAPSRPNPIGLSTVRLFEICRQQVARRRVGHSGWHARLGHQALCIAVRQLSRPALRLAGWRPRQKWTSSSPTTALKLSQPIVRSEGTSSRQEVNQAYTPRLRLAQFTPTRSVSEETTYDPRLRFGLVSVSTAGSISCQNRFRTRLPKPARTS